MDDKNWEVFVRQFDNLFFSYFLRMIEELENKSRIDSEIVHSDEN